MNNDILDYDNGMTHEQISIFLTKATKHYLIHGKSQVEGMTVALASLFKGEVLESYMEETSRVIDSLDDNEYSKAPVNKEAKIKISKTSHERKMNDSMKNLGTLTQVMQGSWNG